MELFIFARFHARPGCEAAVEAALREVLAPTRGEPGCLGIHLFRSVRDARLFHVHSRWRDEAAFDIHGEQPHTLRFVERVEPLIEHALDITRSAMIG
ncbi:MAG: antibiotic biosynthesis monooxygenase [Alphaproteobacteria bacterium]|nr:antibiotic biosynthesis monooxygenase [Alphaproteobacteria bacterium]MDE1987185.1 antibiotic biosynthesis monooxygenase [Alphaproteobacteria bacterium]MDE2163632.1 antibiotic biosynthesis monooxygenase [Alphaproteobacteria bacterium]MDE2265551.1 antibiotic biosynthesis monooxygenase [Alphaproteobacteria bacterium]MDE2500456.1 antibiotic biosynthesis monooxygenase [Alphaproteobacteria bacterium]